MSRYPRLAASLTAAIAFGSLGLAQASAAPAADDSTSLAPLYLTSGQSAAGGEKTYLVTLKDTSGAARASQSGRSQVASIASAAAERGRGKGARVGKVLKGLGAYTATMTPEQLTEIRKDPQVLMVSEPTVKRANVTWGIDRIDQRNLPLSNSYTPDATGAGVHAYVIDTGMNMSHSEYAGRTENGYNAMGDGRTAADCNGHGTHVAGTIAGATYGVAKKATVVPVRVLGCDGTSTGNSVEDGIDWVIQNAKKPAVANMSLGGDADAGLDMAVRRLAQSGVLTAVAAGNEAQNACNVSPAREATMITVGASNKYDELADFSNFGSCVDIVAPGEDITSSWTGSSTATNTISGTSMATPHVVGALALYAQKNPNATQAQADQALSDASTKNVLKYTNGSPNELLYVNDTAGPTDPGPKPTDPKPTDPAPGSGAVVNGGFEDGAKAWSGATGAITDSTGRPAHSGSWKLWLGGNGTTSTESVQQTVTIPANGTLTYWIRVDSAETSSYSRYDTAKVQLVDSSTHIAYTVATHSNLDRSSGYVQKTIDLSNYAGRTMDLRLTSTEDSMNQTSFVFDDIAIG